MKKTGLLALLLILTMVAAGCSTGTSQKGAAQDGSLEITIARAFDVNGLDPGFLTENAQVVDNIFDTLVKRDENEQLVPGLATSWSQVDENTWEFKLRENVKFTNGEPFNAEAVKYSIDRVLNPDNNAPTAGYISTIQEVQVVNDYTVHVITKNPDPLVPTRFNRYPTEIVPPKYTEEVGQEQFAQKPVGTGPYKFVEWNKGSSVVLEVNKDYWNGEPEVKKITFRSIPEASTRVSALLNGEVDLITAVSPEDREKIEGSSNAKLSSVERAGNTVYVGFKTDVEPFNNPKVRQALNYAIDTKSIVDNVLRGAAVQTESLIGPKDFGYAGEFDTYGYDPDKAKQLLSEAGYPDGFSATLDTVNWYIKNTDVAQVIAEQLKAIGVNITVNNVESSVYRTLVPSGKQNSMYVLGWSSTNTLDADAAIYAILHSGESYSTYSNPEVDAKLEEARGTTDEERRKTLYKEIEEIVLQDAPRIFLYQENQYYGVSKKLNWEGRIDGSIPVATMKAADSK
ncbi:peptide/nickel transport system substrate-binding protein [Fontibacillus panacisegetis]|uniref:Peptide/nickel transport system substrate-binding protein n=1 Tax=Fontibacillus panacisegetis TaxID=670482 RepID=A0A1G7QEY7_9BACL|nr:ABC transporter substrate-binding protein [Fontibacillus panacisegetis]SDF97015.1 peptide/nickel transport system substrate-binding protein [Fontibacillus panacisegetis]